MGTPPPRTRLGFCFRPEGLIIGLRYTKRRDVLWRFNALSRIRAFIFQVCTEMSTEFTLVFTFKERDVNSVFALKSETMVDFIFFSKLKAYINSIQLLV